MQRSIITLLFILSSFGIQANDKLVLAKVKDVSHLYALFENPFLNIHYYNDSFIIASVEDDQKIDSETIVLDQKAFGDVEGYYIVYCPPSMRQSYLAKIQNIVDVLYADTDILIVKSNVQVPLAKNDGLVYISQTKASLPKTTINFPVITEIDPFIQYMTETVNTDSIMSYIQHLEDYGTRVYYKPQAYEAQNWLSAKLEAMGLDVEIQDVTVPWFPFGPTTSSGNVIAIQTGTVYPDEYIVCGAHYDSWTWDPDVAPGADDNASGTAGIIELARTLSQFEFERSIIYCLFAAEEAGLHGSHAYASRSRQQGMNILGYFNMDMIGYLKSGTNINISLIYPSVATSLANYYTNIANVYFPNVPITHYSALPGGDSDHTSFNQNGYQGIFPFENINYNYDNPYIHTANDVIGLSVNNPEQCRVFTQLTFASIATLAGLVNTDIAVIAFTADKTQIEEGDTVTFFNLSQNCTGSYEWYFQGGHPERSIEESPIVVYPVKGFYDVHLKVTNGAGTDSIIKYNYISVVQKTNITSYINPEILIYPNPTTGKLNLKTGGRRIKNIEVFDTFGKKVLEQKRQNEIDISTLPNGVYVVQITTENEVVTKKIVKQ
ncbi:MAG: M28 family peptidase [Bacteroidales bacterium]|jgi:PKD repeat protein|nr:M28 family peptidase [Bacteroidales bacterium]